MSWLSRTTKVNGLIKGISDVFEIAPPSPETSASPQRRHTPTHKRRSTGKEDLDRISHSSSSPLGGSQREASRARRPTIGPELSPFGSLSRGRSASALPGYDGNSPSLPAPLLLSSSKLSISENLISQPNSGKRENMWVVLQEELNEQDVTRDDAPAARPLTADENDRAAVWLEIEELRFLEDERLRNQSVKRVVHYLERGNIPLIDRIHLLNAFRGGSPGAEALELQRVVWQWLQRLSMPRLLQAVFVKGWERRVTRFPESLFREFLNQFGDLASGGDKWTMVEDREEVRVHTRTFEDSPVACVRGSTTLQATPEEILDLILHQGDSHNQWDDLYSRGMVRDALSDNIRALRIALKHSGNALKRELHMMQCWAKVDESYVVIMRSIPFTRHQNRAKHCSGESEKSSVTEGGEALSEPGTPVGPRDTTRKMARVAGYVLRPVSYSDSESNRRASTQVVGIYSFDPKGKVAPEAVHALNLRLPLSLHYLSSICYKRSRIIEKLHNAGKIAPPLMVKALISRQSSDLRQLSFKEGDHVTLFKLRSPDITGRRIDCVGYLNGVKGLVSPLYISVLERRRLSSPDYHSLLKLLSEPNMICAQGILAATSPGLKEVTAKAIIILFDEQGQALSLLRKMLSVDFSRTTDVSLLLRGHEASALLISAYSRLIALDFLIDIVTPVVESVIAMDAEGKSFEIDPDKIQPGDDIEANRKNVLQAVDLFMYHILGGVERCPVQLRAVCQFLQKEVSEKFSAVHAHIILGGVMFLRFFCPAIVSPVQHGVREEALTKGAQRGLICVSKIVQQLSNAQSFGGGKEEHMVAFNAYITENIPIVKTYLSKLTSVPYMYEEEPLNRVGDALPFSSAEMTDLGAVLHYVIVQHLDDLHTEIGGAEVSHGTAFEVPFKRLLEILFALPLPGASGLDDDTKVENKALTLFQYFTHKKRPGSIDPNNKRRSTPFRISPSVTKNLETLVAPHAVPLATAQQLVHSRHATPVPSPNHSPLRRHSVVHAPSSSSHLLTASVPSAYVIAPPPALTDSTPAPHAQHRKPLPPPPTAQPSSSSLLLQTTAPLSPMNSSEKASSVASDSSPEGAHLSAIKKEKKEKKKEKKKHKKEKKLKSDASGSRVANNP